MDQGLNVISHIAIAPKVSFAIPDGLAYLSCFFSGTSVATSPCSLTAEMRWFQAHEKGQEGFQTGHLPFLEVLMTNHLIVCRHFCGCSATAILRMSTRSQLPLFRARVENCTQDGISAYRVNPAPDPVSTAAGSGNNRWHRYVPWKHGHKKA